MRDFTESIIIDENDENKSDERVAFDDTWLCATLHYSLGPMLTHEHKLASLSRSLRSWRAARRGSLT